ncbi:hypothetical protein ACQKMD_11310 [Viridibacillus sp. NPDC096237]|uniref:hypothetical protein n=1 Tax=Viridibacillus sp. NPDC096237 TaxID=3390721 RepID=UPI003CFC62C8
MKKILVSIAAFFMVSSVFLSGQASANTSNEGEGTGEINLSDLNLSDLKPGDVIQGEDFVVRQLTDEQAAEEMGYTPQKSKISTFAAKKCATGTTAFSRYLNVNSSYKPMLNIYTELCQNNAGQFVIKSIAGIGVDSRSNGLVKGFEGNTQAKALNSGKTLWYLADGWFHNSGTTTISNTAGLDSGWASVGWTNGSSSSKYGYIYQDENIILFKN